MPANALLVYDRRLGQFICGVTGRLVDGGEVIGFASTIATERVTWADWRSRHPETMVMSGFGSTSNPTRPILPQFKMRVAPMPEPTTPITMLATDPPAAVREDLPMSRPTNVTIGSTRVLLFQDKGGQIRAFDRHLKEDLFLTFEPGQDRRHRDVALIDVDTQSEWTLDGRCLDGPLKGDRLREIELDDRLYWGVMKYWYPDMVLVEGR